MTKTTGYTPKPTPLLFEARPSDLGEWMKQLAVTGGWNPETKVMTRITFDPAAEELDSLTNHVLDSIAAAIEAGIVTGDNFPMSAFASFKDFEGFRESLYDYAETFWVNDRYFWALVHGLGFEESLVNNFENIANALTDFKWSPAATTLA